MRLIYTCSATVSVTPFRIFKFPDEMRKCIGPMHICQRDTRYICQTLAMSKVTSGATTNGTTNGATTNGAN